MGEETGLMPLSYFLLVDEDTGIALKEKLPDITADTRDWALRPEQTALSCCDRRDRIRQVCSSSPAGVVCSQNILLGTIVCAEKSLRIRRVGLQRTLEGSS
jgi:hypothetical protein